MSREPVDPFDMFNLSNNSDDPFEHWDPFGDVGDHTEQVMQSPFTLAQDMPVAHRRTISSPMRLISPQNVTPVQTPMCELPVAQSTWEFNGPSVPPIPMRPPRRPMNFPMLRPKTELPNDDGAFMAACSDPSLRFNPKRLGFIPDTLWSDKEVTFGEVVTDFFQRKNNANSRFSHKLFNALKLSEYDPIYPQFVGVFWLNQTILRVDKRAFARLLGIKSIDGSLFHQQGNFPSHGFFEIGAGDAVRWCPPDLDLTGVDFENVRLLIHTENLFRKGCTQSDIEHCKWASARIGK